MNINDRSPGWDKRAVNQIARDVYGSLRQMFDAHGWDTDGKTPGQVAPTRVKVAYGNVESFVGAHKNGILRNAILNPSAAIDNDPPDVWLTSFYGFTPENWAMFGFTVEADRRSFLEQSNPGDLVVIYGTKDLNTSDAGKVLGVIQVSHVIDTAQRFLSQEVWAKKLQSHPGKWNFGVQILRAWKVPIDCQPSIESFAPATYSHAKAQAIGRYGMRLALADIKSLKALALEEVSVLRLPAVTPTVLLPGSEALRPSRPGPISRNPYLVRESEGPKHLYILRMTGPTDHFVNETVGDREIVKVGFSVSPETRRRAFSAALPGSRIAWEILHSTFSEGNKPFPNSAAALAGEQAMVRLLDKEGHSLGGEFFVASKEAIDRAWSIGNQTAKGHSS
jgi:hypothetical protein